MRTIGQGGAARIAAASEALIDAVGRLTLWLALGMIVLVATNVLLRYSMSLGSVWAQELEWHLLAAMIMLGMSHALQRSDEVRVDLFYGHFGPQKKWWVDLISMLLLLAIALLFVKLSIAYVAQAWAVGERSPDPGGIPWRWAVKGLIPLGFALIALHAVAATIRLVLARPQQEPPRTEASHG
jgi:TRAP-type mannitol/chloroaromatic compound transport system permease small subunit